MTFYLLEYRDAFDTAGCQRLVCFTLLNITNLFRISLKMDLQGAFLLSGINLFFRLVYSFPILFVGISFLFYLGRKSYKEFIAE